MTETLELKKKIEELEQELEEERVRRKITEDYSDCAIWEYEIATKRYVLSKKLGGKWSKSNMVIEDYQQQMHNWGFVHPDDWNIFDDFCAAMDRGDEHIRYEVRQVSDESVFVWFRYVGIPVYDKNHKPYKIMGKTMDVIAKLLFPEISEKEQETLLAECCRIENDYLREHGGVLYPDLEDTFKELKKTYELYIVSNCQKGYIEAFLDHYHFWDYFSDIECYGNNLLQKGDNIRLLADRNHLDEAVYVGDIQGDYDASRKAGVGFIHAAYGFGIVPEAQYKIQSFSELVTKRVAETYFRGLI